MMNLSKELGYSETAKLLIIHADDAGLSHSENMATIETLRHGVVNSYSIMMPCPWFYEMAKFGKENPEFDCGVHLTLTCEWENYRFGPVLGMSEVPSLVDKDGYFYKTREELRNRASATEVKKELKAQIEKALQFGLTPTHLDSHMYSVGASPKFFQIYKDLGDEYGLPVLINRELLEYVGMRFEDNIEEKDIIIDKAHYGKMEYYEKGKLGNYYKGLFDELINGVNIILIHPAYDDLEMQGITINHPNFGSKWRQIAYESFTSEYIKKELLNQEIELITWKDVKELKMRLN